MSADYYNITSKPRWHLLGQSRAFQKIVWVSISVVIVLAILDLAGWIFNIAILKSILPQWIPMKIITAVCFVLAAISLVFIQLNLHEVLRKVFSGLSAVFISLVGITTIYVYLFSIITSQESQLTEVSFLNFFMAPESRMPLLTGCNFFLIGLILFLLQANRTKSTSLAHLLVIPVTVVSYFAIVSYILGVYSSTEFMKTPVALNSGIAFCGICIAVLFMYPDTWLTRVFTSSDIGSTIARRLLPGLMILPVIIGWLRIKGERESLYRSEEGVVYVAITYAVCFFVLVWVTTRAVNRIDRKRRTVEEELKKSHNELLRLNRTLDAQSKSSHAMMHSINELQYLQEVCKIIIEDCGHAMVWVGYAQNDREKSVTPVASYGFDEGYIEQLNVTWADTERGRGPTGTAIRTGKVSQCRNMLTDPAFKPWREAAIKREFASSLVLPLISDGRPFGAISIYSKEPDPFSENEINLLADLANDMAYGISYIRLAESEKAAVMTLKESEEKFSKVFYAAPIAMSLATIPDGLQYDVNQAWLNLVGIESKEEVLGKTFLDLGLVPDEKAKSDSLNEFRKKGSVRNFEIEVTIRDGSIHNLLVNIHTVEIGGRKYMLSTNEDITELKRAEKELNNTKKYLENLINYANAPIIVWNPKTQIQLFNKAFEHLTGHSSVDVVGKKLDLLFPKESIKDSNEKIKLALLENWETIEIPILCKNKDVKTVLWNSANIYDTDNKTLISTIAQGQDITERKQIEEELRLSGEKLDLALDNASIGVWEWDITTNSIEWDERMENIFGIEPGTFEGNYDAFERFLVDEDIARIRKAISNALEFDAPFETVYRIKLNNGDIKHINAKALVNKDPDGKPFKMIGVCFDITEMKRGAEQTLFRLNEELLRSNKELEQFAYVASHDLQEPLRMISSFTQLLSQRYKDKLDNDANEFIQFAVDGANRMQRLINDLLEYSRVETRGKSLSQTDMQIVLGHAINNLKIVIHEKAALVTNDELPVVMADAGQMIQLLQNLIGNSLKFCETTPKIHISAVEEKEYYQFSVKDNGIGIESQYFDKIFSIFQRLHQKEEYEGTGIGLAICRRIVERHGGKIWVESNQGDGTAFKFTLRKKQ
jgi:PAS domain S-box-containing protein